MTLNVHPPKEFFNFNCTTENGRSIVSRMSQKFKPRNKDDQETTLPRGYMVGHGIDVVNVTDFSRLMREPACAFLDRYFTNPELNAAGDGSTRTERLAGRFAIKEAVLKALGVGWGDGISFTDVEIISHRNGAPSIMLHRQLAKLQTDLQITGWLVSASHTDFIAVGSVIALGDGPPCASQCTHVAAKCDA